MMQTQPLTESLLCEVGINRKSASYDKPYYSIYQELKKVALDGADRVLELYDAIKELPNSKVGSYWRECLFNRRGRSVIARGGRLTLREAPILQCEDIEEFNEKFFQMMHLYKAKATLSDYFDLNRRYFKVTDAVLFEDGRVTLDVLPMCYTMLVAEQLPRLAFEKTDLLGRDVEIADIDVGLEVGAAELYKQLGRSLGRDVTDAESVKRVIKDERYARFNRLIDEKFDTEKLIILLTHFEERKDDEIRRMITDNADVPTMFEYVLGIAWYVISDRQGDVLEYMNLSLEADLLPKTHAGGGEADIVWLYLRTDAYPKHTLLIEATLADGTNQRRMESCI